MNKAQLIANMWKERANYPEAYFEHLNTYNQQWNKTIFSSPTMNSNITHWRVTYPPKKWQPEKGKWLSGISKSTHNITYSTSNFTNAHTYIEAGFTRNTKEQIKTLTKKLHTIARLSAWVDENECAKDFEYGTANYYIYEKKTKWASMAANSFFYPEVIYMTKTGANKLVELLNKGEVVL